MWDRVVQWTIAVGERVLAPIERFIGKRSLVGEATFFENDRFPWVQEIEAKDVYKRQQDALVRAAVVQDVLAWRQD